MSRAGRRKMLDLVGKLNREHLEAVGDPEIATTILHQLGLDHQRLTFPFQGLDQKLTGVEEMRVVEEILS